MDDTHIYLKQGLSELKKCPIGQEYCEFGVPVPALTERIIWDEEHGVRKLIDLCDGSAQGWSLTEATAINNVGQIVGMGWNPSGGREAYLLTPIPEPATLAVLLLGGLALLRRRRSV